MKRILKIFSIWFSLIAIVTTAYPQNPKEELKSLLGGLNSFQARFEQVVHDHSGATIQSSRGQVALQRPGKFRWYIEQPTKQLILADGKNLWIYDIDLEQVTKRKQQTKNDATPAMLLSDSTQSLLDAFSVTKVTRGQNSGTWFKLIPRNASNSYQEVYLNFQQGKLAEMQFNSNLGQVSALKFYNSKVNITLKPSLFRFSPPRGVDVINQ